MKKMRHIKIKQLKYYIIFGLLLGLLTGFILFLIEIFFTDLAYHSILNVLFYPHLYGEGICRNFHLNEGWGCLLYNLLAGIIIYSILIMILSLFIYFIKRNKQKSRLY